MNISAIEKSMREERIRKALEVLRPQFLQIENESHKHSGPRTASHYKVLIVSEEFQWLNRLQRQRRVSELLKPEFETGLHALSLRCLTPAEAREQGEEFQSPACASLKPPTES